MKKKLIAVFLAAILLLSAVVAITRESSVDSPVLTADRTEPWTAEALFLPLWNHLNDTKKAP